MRITKPLYKTYGTSAFSVAGSVVLAGVVFSTLSAWWLAVSIPLILLGASAELHEQKPHVNSINL